ncbi:MAG: hypothetical protein FJ088_09685, partial [Deltaproteobacteria bacterium]|nr:hypothetical protein [Deltaproteobacteria bacterium]
HPVLFLGLAGIFVFIRKSARIPLSFLAAFLFFALFAGSLYFFPAWDFGGRKYIEILPMFSFGFAALYDALGGNKRFPIKIVAASLLVSAVLWNILLLILYYPMDAFDRNGYIPYYEILHRFLILIEKAVNFPYVFAAIAAVVIAITLAVVFQKRNFTVPDMDFPVPGARFAALIAAASIAFSVFFIASDSLSSLYKTIVPGPEVGFRAVPVKLKDPDDFAGTGISKRVDGEVVVELTGPLDSGDEMRLAFRTVNPDALDGIGIEFFDGAGKEVFKTSMRKENASIFPDYCNGGLNGQHRLFLPFPARISGLLNSFSLEKEKREAGCNPCFAVFRLNPEERFSFERLRIKASSGNISFEGLLFL